MTKQVVSSGESLWLIEQTSTVDGRRRFWNGAGYGWDALRAARYPSKDAAEEVARNSSNCTMSTVHGHPEICEHLFQCGAAPASVSPQAPTAVNLSCTFGEGVGQGGTAAGADWVRVQREKVMLVHGLRDAVLCIKKGIDWGCPLCEGMNEHKHDCIIEEVARFILSAAPRPDTGEGEKHWVYAAAKAHRQLLANAVGTDVAWGFNHLTYMLTEIDGMKSATKACRWLGWVQACLCFTGCATLNELKMINKVASEAARALRRGEGRS